MTQEEKLYLYLKDGLPHRTDHILKAIYGSEHLGIARISARIFGVKKRYGVDIKGWKDDKTPSLYWYRLIVRTEPQRLFEVPERELETQVIF